MINILFALNYNCCFLLQIWKDSLWETMETAGKEEQIAREKGDIDENGVAKITVVADGGWSKRSFGHTYNALSGVVSFVQINHFAEFFKNIK